MRARTHKQILAAEGEKLQQRAGGSRARARARDFLIIFQGARGAAREAVKWRPGNLGGRQRRSPPRDARKIFKVFIKLPPIRRGNNVKPRWAERYSERGREKE